MTASKNPLRELRTYVIDFAERCKAARWLGALFHVNVITDIVADAEHEQKLVAEIAYTAEQADLEAAKLLEEAARDGFSDADLPAVEKAIRMIRRSAQLDRRISDTAA